MNPIQGVIPSVLRRAATVHSLKRTSIHTTLISANLGPIASVFWLDGELESRLRLGRFYRDDY